jgi:uncharacterized membrane protein (DUF106 family)
MQELTAANIEAIVQEVSRAGITFSHLRDEIIDHICCEIENAMRHGLNFNDAFEKIRGTVGTKGLKKIQEDTLTLIDKKYRLMKNTMKIFGLVSLVMITVGALFKIQHWPGAGPLLVFGFLLLGGLFFPSALWIMKKESKLKGSLFIYLMSIIGGALFIFGILFKIQHYPYAGILLIIGFSSICLILIPSILISKLRDENAKNLRGAYIIGACALALYLFGDLFKIMHWPGAGIMLILGAIVITAIFLPVYAWKVYGKSETIKPGFIFLCIGIVFFNMFNLLLAINVSRNVIGYFVNPAQETIKTAGILENKNNLLVEKITTDSLIKDTLLKSDIQKIKSASDEFCNYLEGIKKEVIAHVDGISIEDASAPAKNPALITDKVNYDVPTNLLIGNSQDGSNGQAAIIKKKMEALKETLIGFCPENENAKSIILKALETDSVLDKNEGKYYSWELSHFYHLIAISVINKLSCFQRNARIAELQTIECLASKQQPFTSELINKNN